MSVVEDLTNGSEKFPVPVVNAVDYTKPPPFTYAKAVRICVPAAPSTSKTACHQCSCPSSEFKEGALRLGPNNHPFDPTEKRLKECGPVCSCPEGSAKCRPTQQGILRKFEVFKTYRCGWGLRAKETIEPGTFIAEYAGEVVKYEESSSEHLYDATYAGKNVLLDATKFGNITRFINHSCDPNVCAYEVERNGDPLVHICLFAVKRIVRDEELTISYNSGWWEVMRQKKIFCKCDSAECGFSENLY